MKGCNIRYALGTKVGKSVIDKMCNSQSYFCPKATFTSQLDTVEPVESN